MAYTNNLFDDFKQQFTYAGESAYKVGSSIGSLTSLHLELLDEELRIQKQRSIGATVLFTIGIIGVMVSAIFFSFAFAPLLGNRVIGISTSGGFAIVGLVWLIVAPIFIAIGAFIYKKIKLFPAATVSSFKESIKCLNN
jgi:ABC-type uncharacterized transport system fused permease/ATPase subunit